MKPLYPGALIAVLVLAGGYFWYETAYSKCRIPMNYRIGEIDARFGISKDEVRAALSDAESLWEDATGKNLFTYSEEGGLVVSFVFDERQAVTTEAEKLKDILKSKEEVSESIRDQYEDLLDAYEKLKGTYETRADVYEKQLSSHNAEVEEWNTKGGAPREVYERLEAEEASLMRESAELNALAKRLNSLSRDINELGEKGNEAVKEYNEDVTEYNSRFNDDREFTQGDYRNNRINIYQYKDGTELRTVLAHEFGHALSLEHVTNNASVLYHLMEDDRVGLALTTEDLAEFNRVCGNR